MCGEVMQLHKREVSDRVPGTHEVKITTFGEWVCPECEYFEEAEESEG